LRPGEAGGGWRHFVMDQRVPESDRQEFCASTWGAEHALKALIECQAESLYFIARRLYCDLDFMRRLRDCAGWQEIAELQQSWLSDCVADHGREWVRMLGAGFGVNANTPLQCFTSRPASRGRGNGLVG
jgi:hypothetical protein